MGFLSNKPYEREYLGEGYEGLAAQGALQPGWAGVERQWRPEWANIGNLESQVQMFGSAGQPGALGLGNRAARNTMRNLEQWSPTQYGLLGSLGQQATDELQNPYAMSPAEVREITNWSRTPGLASFGAQPMEAYLSYANLGGAAVQRAQQRRGFAADVMGLEQQYRVNPAMQTRNTMMNYALNKPVSPSLINPWNAQAQDVNNTNFNAEATNANAMSSFGMSMVPKSSDY
jgi:hypothetical protein